MLNRIRHTVRDLFAPGGLRRHPVLCLVAVVVVGLVVIGLALRPL